MLDSSATVSHEALLRERLCEAQLHDLDEHRAFNVRASDNRLYRITEELFPVFGRHGLVHGYFVDRDDYGHSIEIAEAMLTKLVWLVSDANDMHRCACTDSDTPSLAPEVNGGDYGGAI